VAARCCQPASAATAAAFAATVPVAIVFAWLQRYLVRGLALGAVK
jgi:multiple sugar transport system permease protein